jgi:hypothetical protein
MKNYQRYLYGILVGGIMEYLFRVQFSGVAFMTATLIILLILVDLKETDFNKKI